MSGAHTRPSPCRHFLLAVLVAVLLAACARDRQPENGQPQSSIAAPASDPAASAALAVEAAGIPTPTLVNDPSGAAIYVYDFGPLVLHAFVNPAEGYGTATYIVEGASSLVLIDSHYSAAPAHAFRAYADSLGKPLARIYLTHEHPDHINGLRDAFADVPSYAGPETASLIAGSGIEIDHLVAGGSEEIDGLTYAFGLHTGAESAESLVIMLPEYGILASGDLLYNHYHMVLNRNLDPWISILEKLEEEGTFALILPGHGPPDDATVLGENLDYLKTASRLYRETDDQNIFIAAMSEAFPDHAVLSFLRLGAGRMYPRND